MMAQAMLTGQIVDADDGGPIPYASASYKGQHKAVSSDADGKFSIERHEGWTLTFSSVGYTPVSITVNAATKELTIKLKSESRKIDEIGGQGTQRQIPPQGQPCRGAHASCHRSQEAHPSR